MREQKGESISDFVIADSKGKPLNYGQFQRMWKYVTGKSIKFSVKNELGQARKNRPSIVARLIS